MERTIKLSLRQKNGEYKEFMTDFVPYSKRQEYVSLENKLREKYKGKQEEPDMSEYDEMQAEFVAGLFNSKEVTKKTIMDGLDTIDSEKIGEIIRYRVLGFSKEEDDLRKSDNGETLSWGDFYDLNLEFVRNIISTLSGWTIRDLMNTDCMDVDEILLKSSVKKKKKKVKPLAELVKGKGG